MEARSIELFSQVLAKLQRERFRTEALRKVARALPMGPSEALASTDQSGSRNAPTGTLLHKRAL